jgi:hypothetical protein
VTLERGALSYLTDVNVSANLHRRRGVPGQLSGGRYRAGLAVSPNAGWIKALGTAPVMIAV